MINNKIVKEFFSLVGMDISDKSAENFIKKFPILKSGSFFQKESFKLMWRFSIFPRLKKLSKELENRKELYVLDKETGEMIPYKE